MGFTHCTSVKPPDVGLTHCTVVKPPDVGLTLCTVVKPQGMGSMHCVSVKPPGMGFTHSTSVKPPDVGLTHCTVVKPPVVGSTHFASVKPPDVGLTHCTVVKPQVMGSTHSTSVKPPDVGLTHCTVVKPPVVGSTHCTSVKPPDLGLIHCTVVKPQGMGCIHCASVKPQGMGSTHFASVKPPVMGSIRCASVKPPVMGSTHCASVKPPAIDFIYYSSVNPLLIVFGCYFFRECTIVLESEGEHKVSLGVSYVVSQASWTPSYDLRLFTGEGVLKIMYYGQITQTTGEDWKDAKLFLSTASPSIGGMVPLLGTAVLSTQRPISYVTRSRSFQKSRISTYAPVRSWCRNPAGRFEDLMESFGPMPFVETKVTESTTSTSYEIARQTSIPSDNLPHKVSVGIFDVKPKLEYITIPKVEPRAYLQAKVTNNSVFTLLPGATSIFLDNSFVAKAEIKLVSPGEEFLCSLGVDPAVKVIYKPLKKFKASTGLISKTTNTTYEQVVEIKNTHEYSIDIVLKLQVPRSSDDKIKVTLLVPSLDLKHPKRNTNPHITKQYHVVWKLDLAKQVTREITLKYTVDHPPQQETYLTEAFEKE
ncbi:protein F37C4.5-like isoform X1 [Haliotis asinina]|uniref:protein F37C4.5-like isoform X1 n=1 Tax=Haliotis asinina TaxID=109174 RepID=UPI003532554C